MDCSNFKAFYDKHRPAIFNGCDEDEYLAYVDHMDECSKCGDWYMQREAEACGVNLDDFPCAHLAYHSRLDCKIHDDPFESCDVLIVKTSKGYGIPIHDGGTSFVEINYCPWCGVKVQKE